MRLEPRTVFSPSFAIDEPVLQFLGNDTTRLGRADIGCLLINSADDSSVVSSALRAAVGLDFPLEAGTIVNAYPRRVLWLTPRSWLLHCLVEEECVLATRINDAFPDKRVHAAVFTDCLCWFELCGLQGLDQLTNGGFISLERDGLKVGHVKRTSIAGIAAVVVHLQSATWLLGIDRSRAMYFKEWLQAGRSVQDLPSQSRHPNR